MCLAVHCVWRLCHWPALWIRYAAFIDELGLVIGDAEAQSSHMNKCREDKQGLGS